MNKTFSGISHSKVFKLNSCAAFRDKAVKSSRRLIFIHVVLCCSGIELPPRLGALALVIRKLPQGWNVLAFVSGLGWRPWRRLAIVPTRPSSVGFKSSLRTPAVESGAGLRGETLIS